MVFIFSPIVGISGIEVYYGGIGGSIFVGASLAISSAAQPRSLH